MDGLKAVGKITIYEGKKEDNIIIAEFKNLVLDVNKKGILNLWAGIAVGYGKYDFLAIGSGSSPVKPEDIKLGTEVFRKPISAISIMGSNRLIIDTFIDVDEANFSWKELGLYSGGTWDALDSGVLLNRALVNEEKNSGKSKTISWEITLT